MRVIFGSASPIAKGTSWSKDLKKCNIEISDVVDELLTGPGVGGK